MTKASGHELRLDFLIVRYHICCTEADACRWVAGRRINASGSQLAILPSAAPRLAPILVRVAVTTFGTSTCVVQYLGRRATRAHPPDDLVRPLAKQPGAASNSPKFFHGFLRVYD